MANKRLKFGKIVIILMNIKINKIKIIMWSHCLIKGTNE